MTSISQVRTSDQRDEKHFPLLRRVDNQSTVGILDSDSLHTNILIHEVLGKALNSGGGIIVLLLAELVLSIVNRVSRGRDFGRLYISA